MLDEPTRQVIFSFVRRYVAADASGAARDGHFAICAGTTSKNARTARDSVPFGTHAEQTAETVCDVVADVLASGEGNVWVRAFYKGASNFTTQIKIAGYHEPDPSQDAATLDPDVPAMHHAIGAIVRTNTMLSQMVADRDRRLELATEHRVKATEVTTLLIQREGIADIEVRRATAQAMVREGAQAIAPLVPVLVEHFLRQQQPAQAPTGSYDDASISSADRVGRAVDTITAAAQAIARECAAGVPDGAAPHLARLQALVAAVQAMGAA